ncbi:MULTISPECIES: hypothetical protein [unclassified Micromonospora]|uniref:hypothetical protein n=1 Tax=unclassified Micromonospora TaxID=2617518 RepID=UPI001128A590|nr:MULTISPECIES: hypothetical protein [unclassified Micromonospora]MCK1807074.1 hypothetical protein [Micromonospora sp. R42106]MCK1831779.1 hypothetical protein [Micromonospora sp. R42003]MCK1844515.1 hypothetical protein [Micromonospora sp. R42004]MCM1016901.1 hypothetical protein [Micromonospora sp. XM-20-01]
MQTEDPPEDLFTREIPYHGGPHLAIEGLSTESGYVATLLLRAIFNPRDNHLPEEYRSQAALLATTLLRVSDLLCRRAGLSRGRVPNTKMRENIFVPGRDYLTELSEAVLLTPEDLARILPLAATHVIYDLALPPRDEVSTSPEPNESLLVVKPFMKVADGVLVTNPAELTASLRHNLITLAQRHGCAAELAEAFRLEVARQTVWVLGLFGMRPIAPLDRGQDPLVARQRFEFAGDKILDLAVITDDLDGYDPNDPYGMWNVPNLSERVHDVIDPARDPVPEDSNTLRLILQEPLGRGYVLGLMPSRLSGPILMARLSELEVIAALDGNDPLALWRFAEAESRLEQSTRVVSFGALDSYGLYRSHEYSYYLSDDHKPTFLTISSDHSLPLKAEANRKTDAHEVPSPHRPAYIQVVSMHGADKAPIYLIHPRHDEDETLVELDGLNVWFGAGAAPPHNLRGFVNEIAPAAAYWTWQLSKQVPELLQGSTFEGRLYVELVPDDAEAWSAVLSQVPEETNEQTWVCAGDSNWGQAKLLLKAQGAWTLFLDQNHADRLLVSALAMALSDATGVALQDIPSIVDRVAPVGRKKVIRVNKGSQVALRPPFFRSARLVQPAVSGFILDELGEWLTADGLPEGQVPDEKRNELLQKCVSHHFEQIQAIVSELDPNGLIEFLVRRDETLIHSDAVERESLAYRIACFGESPDLTQEIAEGERKRTEAAIASRFLVEYVAATPPSGQRPITLDTYDRLLATAAEIYARATLSDAIHHEFSDATLSLLKSGRLGTSRGDRYDSGTGAFSIAQAEAIRLMALGVESSPRPVSAKVGPPASTVEAGMLAEFGFTLTELGEGIGTLIGFGDERCSQEPCRVPIVEVEQELTSTLGWTKEKARRFIDALALRPRRNFLSVGPDAWPWRYNREWSYARRPLIQAGNSDGGEDLVWGVRRLWSTAGYWVGLLYSGRMRAKSPELTRVVSTIRQDENKAFEQRVADALGSGGCAITATGLAKVRGKKLQSSAGDDLGDIDALGIHVQRRLIFVAEAKDFELARIPRELANEAESLLYGQRSALRKLTGRANWVRQNLPAVIQHFNLDLDASGWSVVPVIVTSRSLVTPKVLACPLPVIAIDDVEEFVQKAVSRARPSRVTRKAARRGR